MFPGIRHHPPVHSPLPATAVAWGAAALISGRDSRAELGDLLRRRYAADGAWLTRSGTHALQRGLELAACERGSRCVALPAYGCYDLAAAAIGANLEVVLYDLDPATLAPDPDSVEAALRRGARLVVAASLFGFPVPWAELEAVAAPHEAFLLEDAAQGLGGAWEGRPIGSFGDMTILSFGRGKGWTGGAGGALLTRGEGAAIGLAPSKAGSGLRSIGLAAAMWALGRPTTYGIPASLPFLGLGETRYRAPTDPEELPAACAAVLLAGRPAAEEEASRRRAAGDRWSSVLESTSQARPIRPGIGGAPGFLRYPVRLPQGMHGFADPREVRRLGIAPGYPAPLSSLPQLAARQIAAQGRFPGAEVLVRELVTLPTHSWLKPVEWEAALAAVRSYRSGTAHHRGHTGSANGRRPASASPEGAVP
jgi:perosamine synthetase